MSEPDQKRKRIGIKEILGGLGLGSLMSFLTVQPFRFERIAGLKKQIADITERITHEFEQIKPTAKDVLGMDRQGVADTLDTWAAQRFTQIAKETAIPDTTRSRLEDYIWDGTREAYSQLSSSQKILVYAAGITTMIGGVMAINHWRNKSRDNKEAHSERSTETKKKLEPTSTFAEAEQARRNELSEQRAVGI